MDEDSKSASPLWAFNPETRRYVLRNGPTWARLVKRGVASDPELQEQWAAAALAPKPATPAPKPEPKPSVPALSARDVLRQLAVENREALCREDLTREEAEALLRRAFESRAQPKTASRRWTLNAER